uniref:Uncharacterized protein n=1 Tax=Tanacetum cinerariifolium TaxID=118510 RepID=A0A6L2MRD3_TANCI|nr:hypothetical protein [Tanacetum cinerariifolium]
MTYPVADPTLDSARSYVMQGAPFTQGTISSIPIGGSISPEGFLPSILLMVVTVVIVVVILVVIIVVIVGVNCALLPAPLIFGLCPGDLVSLLYSNRFGIGIPPGQGILGESTSSKFHFAVLGTVATRKYRFSSFKPLNETNSSFRTIEVESLATHKLLNLRLHEDNGMSDSIGGLVSLGSSGSGFPPSGRDMIHNELSNSTKIYSSKGYSGGGIVDLTGDEDPIDEDGDTRVGDLKVSVSLGKISLGGKKSRESYIGDTKDGGKAFGRAKQRNRMVGRRHRVVNNPVGLLLIFYCCYGSVRIPFVGKRGVVGDDLNGGKEVTRSLQGDDGGACKVLGWLLGGVMEVMRSIISMVFISPEGFMPSILLVVVIIVTVVIGVVTVIFVVVVVAIIGVVIVVTIIGHRALLHDPLTFGLCSRAILIGQESFQFSPGYLVGLLLSNRFGIGIPPGQGIFGESTSSKFHFVVLGTVAMRKYRFSSFKPTNENNSSFHTIEVERLATHKLLSGDGVVDLTSDEDRDIGMGDSTGVSASLGGKIFSREKKCQESNIGDSVNTGDGGKIVSGALGACGERASEDERSLVKSSKKLGAVFPGEAGK